MFRSFLAAGLRNLARGGGYAAISIVGLAVGLCSAILMALVLRNQYSFDRFIPDHERLHLAVTVDVHEGHRSHIPLSNTPVAELLKLRFSEVEATTRLAPDEV